MIVGIVAFPLLLRWLGDERCGAYRVAMEWVGYAALFDLGLVGTIQVLIAKASGAKDRIGVVEAVHAGVLASLWLAAVFVLFTIFLVIAAPTLVRGLTPELIWELRIGLLVGLVGILWTPLVAFRPLAEASQRGYVVQLGLVVQNLTTAGLMIGLAAFGAGLPGQFLAASIGSGVAALILARDGVGQYPEILSQRIRAIALPRAFSGQMFLYQICARVSLMSDCIIVGLLLGSSAVVTFTSTQRLLLLAGSQVMSIGSSAWAALADLHHKKEYHAFNLRLTQLTRITGVAAFAFMIPIASFNVSFVSLWVGGNRYGGIGLSVMTLVFSWLLALVGLWGWPLITTGHVRVVLPVLLISAVVNVTVSIVSTSYLGVVGPALGSSAGLGFINLWLMPILLRRVFQTPLRPLVRAVAEPALLGVPTSVVLFFLAREFSIDQMAITGWARWMTLAFALSISAALYFILAWFLVLPHQDRQEIRSRVFGR